MLTDLFSRDRAIKKADEANIASSCPRRLLGARRSLVGMNDLKRNYET